MKRIRWCAWLPRVPRSLAVPGGFTLVELLITIAIIVILAGILFPIVGRARARAGLTMCASNLQQLYQATAMYAADYGGYLPPYTSYTHQDDPRIPLLLRTDYSSELVSVLHPYAKSHAIWFCPADPFAGMDSHVMGVYHKNTSYRTSNFWYGEGTTLYPRLGSASLDMSIWSKGLRGEWTSSMLMMYSDNLWACQEPEQEDGIRYEAYYSHGERFNNVYFDGHTINFTRGHNDQCFDF